MTTMHYTVNILHYNACELYCTEIANALHDTGVSL